MKIVSIGAGNVASHMIPHFQSCGYEIIQVVGRSRHKTKKLADKLACKYTTSFNRINQNADVYLFTVPDHAIRESAEKIKFKASSSQFAFHFSGTSSMNELENFAENRGVLWPIQTFNSEVSLTIMKIPFCLSANSNLATKTLDKLSKGLKKSWLEEKDRSKLHAAAVLSCNFTNHLMHLVYDYLKDNNIPFDYLEVLMNETVRKSFTQYPGDSQTGPAIRDDLKTIRTHLEMLKEYPELKALYSLFTKSIQKYNT